MHFNCSPFSIFFALFGLHGQYYGERLERAPVALSGCCLFPLAAWPRHALDIANSDYSVRSGPRSLAMTILFCFFLIYVAASRTKLLCQHAKPLNGNGLGCTVGHFIYVEAANHDNDLLSPRPNRRFWIVGIGGQSERGGGVK